MFQARLSKASTWKKMFEAIRDFRNEVSFDCSPRGINVAAMDVAQISLFYLNLNSEGFEYFICDREFSFGIPMSSWAKIMNCANNDDTVTIIYKEDADTVSLEFDSPEQGKLSQYNLKLIDLQLVHTPPDLMDFTAQLREYSCVIHMPSLELKRLCHDLKQFGNTVAISCTETGVRFSASGDFGKGNVYLSKSQASLSPNEEAINIEIKEVVKLSFPLQHLITATKATPLSKRVTLIMSKGMPLGIEYVISNLGHLRFYIAPKIDDDNDDGEID